MATVRWARLLPVFLAAFCLLGAYAHAGTITVNNETRHEINMAFKFFDYKKKKWVVWGWYTVPAHTSKKMNFTLAPDRKVYWYGKADGGKRFWPGAGEHEQSVINKKMSGIEAGVLKTYADSKVVKFKMRDPNSEGNLSITLVTSD